MQLPRETFYGGTDDKRRLDDVPDAFCAVASDAAEQGLYHAVRHLLLRAVDRCEIKRKDDV